MISSTLVFLRSLLLGICDLYVAVILIYILMSWLPNHQFGWVGDIYRALGRICDPFLNVFRRIIPPIGGMLDISPISRLSSCSWWAAHRRAPVGKED